MSKAAKAKPANLTINPQVDRLVVRSGDSPQTATSPLNLEGIDLSSFGGDFSAPLLTLPSLPSSPPSSPQTNKDSSKTFLTSFKSRVTSEQGQRADPPQRRPTKDDDEYRPSSSSVSKIYHLRKNPGSTPELSLVGSAESDRKQSDDVPSIQTPESKPLPPPLPSEETSATKRRDKVFRNPLSRAKSIRRDSNSKARPDIEQTFKQPPKTAPLISDWQSSAEQLLKPRSNQRRGKSAERAVASESEDNLTLEKQAMRDRDRGSFKTGSKMVMSKAKSGGGNLLTKLGKLGRAGSHHDKETPDSEYVMKVIKLPLVEQTRITRISKDLSSCRDKTEYWMPSLPWRCIDYLNLNCESEGLYRVPGSGPQVKHWQRRFDTEIDLDLLDEEQLYDPNIIGSMLKSWLRDLPTEIMPKSLQASLADDIAKDNPNYQRLGEKVPQKLRDALSELPPFNYYLLFAITCHLSLLLSHKDKNKMDLNNLSICIGPCLDLDRWLFNYLVGDWRHCWQGCYTEKQFLEAEKAYEQGEDYEPPVSREGNRSPNVEQMSQVSALDDKATSNGSFNESGDDSRQIVKPLSPPPSENVKPQPSLMSLPDYSQYVNGNVPSTPDRTVAPAPSPQRPSTAHNNDTPLTGTVKPKVQSHSRSQSELPSPSLGLPLSLSELSFDSPRQE